MERGIREWIWEIQFFLTFAALIAVVALIPLWTVFAISYGIITDNDNFILRGGLGLFPGMPIVALALCGLDNNPD